MEKTIQLYKENAYTTGFNAVVLSCNKTDKYYEVILDQSAFYPEGGGQPSDIGMLDDAKVLDVHNKDDIIIHYTKQPLQEGKVVHGIIDWKRRFSLMQNHTGEHILSGLIHKQYGYDNVGFHMGEMIQVDFNGFLDEAQLMELEDACNQVIYQNLPVQVLYPNEGVLETMEYRSKKELDGEIRIVEIEDVDRCACCGTHVKQTGEVGYIKIISSEKHKDGVRIFMLSGERAQKYVQEVFKQNHDISVLLSAKMNETAKRVQLLQEEIHDLIIQSQAMTEKYLEEKMKDDIGKDKIIAFFQDIDRNVMRKYANHLIESGSTLVAFLLEIQKDTYNYFILSNEINLRDSIKTLNESLQGKGGGSAEMIQGTFMATQEEIQTVIENMFDFKGSNKG